LLDIGLQKSHKIQSRSKKLFIIFSKKKRRNYANPEEPVQAESYLRLVLEYGYAPKRITMFETVRMGRAEKEADIIVECKKPEVYELEFSHAIDQAFSYAVAYGAKFV
jgi:hypothetical protein